MTSSAIIYQGPSQLDGAPIVVVATGLDSASSNVKTGAMVQTWILRADVAPLTAIRAGQDASICGTCRHRGEHDGTRWTATRTCYVQVHNAPQSVYNAFQRGRYPTHATRAQLSALGAGRTVRIGSYGDPAAVPARVWRALTRRAQAWTGYTHQWSAMRARTARVYQTWLMASADTPTERATAHARGWRTFTVAPDLASVARTDVLCPASAEAGHKTVCARCTLCSGARTRADGRPVPSVAIVAHGSGARAFARAAA